MKLHCRLTSYVPIWSDGSPECRSHYSIDQVVRNRTFKSRPKQFTRSFALHGMKNNNCIPLVFRLLQSFSTTYEAALKLIISECQKLNLWKPYLLMSKRYCLSPYLKFGRRLTVTTLNVFTTTIKILHSRLFFNVNLIFFSETPRLVIKTGINWYVS